MIRNLDLILAAFQMVFALYFQAIGEVGWSIWCVGWAVFGVIMYFINRRIYEKTN